MGLTISPTFQDSSAAISEAKRGSTTFALQLMSVCILPSFENSVLQSDVSVTPFQLPWNRFLSYPISLDPLAFQCWIPLRLHPAFHRQCRGRRSSLLTAPVHRRLTLPPCRLYPPSPNVPLSIQPFPDTRQCLSEHHNVEILVPDSAAHCSDRMWFSGDFGPTPVCLDSCWKAAAGRAALVDGQLPRTAGTWQQPTQPKESQGSKRSQGSSVYPGFRP